jgi:hypothetical protein
MACWRNTCPESGSTSFERGRASYLTSTEAHPKTCPGGREARGEPATRRARAGASGRGRGNNTAPGASAGPQPNEVALLRRWTAKTAAQPITTQTEKITRFGGDLIAKRSLYRNPWLDKATSCRAQRTDSTAGRPGGHRTGLRSRCEAQLRPRPTAERDRPPPGSCRIGICHGVEIHQGLPLIRFAGK